MGGVSWEGVRLASSFDAPLRLHCDPLGSGPQHLGAFSCSTLVSREGRGWIDTVLGVQDKGEKASLG